MMTSFDRLHIDLTVPEGFNDDYDNQLVIGDERAFIELQEIEYIRTLGARALIAAQHMINIAYECRDALQEWDEVPATRRKRVDVIAAVPDLVEDDR